MHRLRIAAAAVVSISALYACGGRETPAQQNPDAGNTPCVGTCADAGQDGGNNNNNGNDAGTDAGGLTRTIAQLRSGGVAYGQAVRVENAVVTAVGYQVTGGQGDTIAEFWVADPNDPASGIWVEKYFFDEPGPYAPEIGDVLNINGFYGNNSGFENGKGFRQVIKSQFDFNVANPQDLVMELVDAGAPLADNEVTLPFGDALGGDVAANPEFGGSRVRLTSAVTLTDPAPEALTAIAYGKVVGSNGFEVADGILVNDFYTKAECDWASAAADAGNFGETVVFPNGVSGIWDSYTHAPCVDAGTGGNCFRDRGYIPGSSFDGGSQPTRWTYVLYPQSCEDLQGQVQ